MTQEGLARLRTEVTARVDLFRRLIDRFGPGVLDVLAESVSERARDSLAAAPLKHRTLDAVMELLWDQMDGSAEFKVVERTSESLRLRVTRCAYAEEIRSLGAAEIGLAAYCAYDAGFCQGLNPEIRFTRTQTLMMGDPCCNHVYSLPPSNSLR